MPPRSLSYFPNVTSFHLEAQELNPLRWVWLPPKLKNAVKRILAFDFLEELIVDWWEFEMPADELYRMLLRSSQASLKRLTLNVPLKPLLAPSTRIGGGSSENQITLDLDYFEIATGDTYRTYYGPQSVDPLIHFIPPFTITSSNGLAFRVAAGMAKGFRFEDWYEQLRDLVAPCVKSLYIKGIDADPPFDLSNFTRLETLTVVPAPEYGRSCPRLAAETLKTVKHPNSLAFIQLASAADSGVHTTYFEEFLETLSSKKFPDLKTVNIYYEVEGMPSITERLQALVSSDRLRDEKFSLRLTFI
ncbi:hypothetical protein BKA70DRAFT_1417195 [Coprinopsis sp. MPI-PUGE-AT-0042]|nr:hypothetical protein BKA70DRAFT_1417195 [Coprinopsis sp. MPI-PUGE-AT-0042]